MRLHSESFTENQTNKQKAMSTWVRKALLRLPRGEMRCWTQEAKLYCEWNKY